MILFALGFFAGTIGTLVGAGGGFLLMPALLFLFPQESHDRITALSLVTVAFNATSGSLAYFLAGRVHMRAALWFTLAGLPGAFFGVWLEHLVARSTFELIFGGVLITYALFLLMKKGRGEPPTGFHVRSTLTREQYLLGALISVGVGFMASFLGIGGGVIHVPLLSHALHFPVHIAAGTSHMILFVTAWVASFQHIWHGDISLFEPAVLSLALGAVLGAQVGARLSRLVSGVAILRLLGGALLLVGIRLIIGHL